MLLLLVLLLLLLRAETATMQDYCKRQGVQVRKAMDVACSAGDSTRRLADRFPEAQLAGIDLSPNFLAVAELRRRYWRFSVLAFVLCSTWMIEDLHVGCITVWNICLY